MNHHDIAALRESAYAGRTDTITRAHREMHAQAQTILEHATRSGRDLSADEHREFDALSNKLGEMQNLLDIANKRTHAASVSARYSQPNSSSHEWREALAGRDVSFDIDLGGAYRAHLAQSGKSFERRDLTTTVGTVPTQVLNELILRLTQQSGVLAAAPRTINTTDGGTLKVPTLTAFSTASVIGEGATISESDPTLAAVSMSAYKFAAILQVSNELLTDTAFDIERYLGEQLGTAAGLAISSALASTNAGTAAPQGVMGTATTTGVTGGTALAGAPTVANLINLYHSVPSQYRGDGFGWIMHSDTMAHIANLLDTQNRSILLPSLSGDAPSTLLGKPVYIDNQVASFGTATASIWCGSMRDFYAVRFAGALRVDASRDYAFTNDLITYRVIQRLDGRIINADAGRKFVGGAS